MATTHTITLDADLHQLLQDVSSSELRSPEFVLRDALVEYAARHERLSADDRAVMNEHDAAWDAYDGPTKTRAEVLAEADEASRHMHETGLHLTNEDIHGWIERLKTDPDAKLPECHT